MGSGLLLLLSPTFFSFSGSIFTSGDFGRLTSWEVLGKRGSDIFSTMGPVDFTDSLLSVGEPGDDLVAGGGDTFLTSVTTGLASDFAALVSPSLCSRKGGGERDEAESFCFTSLISFSACWMNSSSSCAVRWLAFT